MPVTRDHHRGQGAGGTLLQDPRHLPPHLREGQAGKDRLVQHSGGAPTTPRALARLGRTGVVGNVVVMVVGVAAERELRIICEYVLYKNALAVVNVQPGLLVVTIFQTSPFGLSTLSPLLCRCKRLSSLAARLYPRPINKIINSCSSQLPARVQRLLCQRRHQPVLPAGLGFCLNSDPPPASSPSNSLCIVSQIYAAREVRIGLHFSSRRRSWSLPWCPAESPAASSAADRAGL